MQLEVTVDGEPYTVDVDLARGVVRWNGREFPAKVVRDADGTVELEIAGEKSVVEGWPEGAPEPRSPVVVSSERYAVSVRRVGPVGAPPPNVVPTMTPTATLAPTPSRPGPGTAVLPPMPGKIVELRVRNGDRVEKGQVLLVLEAMKMRNEVAAPVAGTVVDLRVAAGANVRAREPMLTLVP